MMPRRTAALFLFLVSPLWAQGTKVPATLADLQRQYDDETEKAVRAVNEKRLKAIDGWLKAHPAKGDDRGTALIAAAEVASGLQKNAESAAYAQKYLEELPTGPARLQAGNLAGQGLLSLGKDAEAQKAFEAALEGAKPADEVVEVVEALGLLHLKAGRKDEALKTYEQVETIFGKGAASFVKGLKEGADKLFTAPPPLEAKDLEGKDLTWDRFKGKLVLLDFWATWCGPCVGEFPNVLRVYRKYHDRGFEVVGISLDKEREALDKFLKEKGAPWPQNFDGQGWQNAVAKKWGVQSIPATYLISPDGKIIRMNLRGPKLEQVVAMNLPRK